MGQYGTEDDVVGRPSPLQQFASSLFCLAVVLLYDPTNFVTDFLQRWKRFSGAQVM